MKERTLDHIRNLIRKGITEDAPTNSLSSGQIAGTKEAGDLPPVDLRKNKFKKLPGPYRDLFRRKSPK